MKLKLKFFIFIFVFLACDPGFGGEVRKIIDARGQTVQITLPIRRVVVLSSNALEVIQILQAEDLVVGVSDYIHQKAQLWSKFQDRPVVGHWNEPDYELIATLQPDLVLCYGRFPGLEAEQKLMPLGIQVLRLDLYKISTLPGEVRVLGDILGKQNQAGRFLHWYDQKLRQIKEASKHSLSAPKVYLEGFSKYQTLGPGSGGYELSTFIGASNIASVFPTSFARITPEWVLSQNPDIIVKVVSLKDSYSYDNHQKFQNIQLEIMQRPGWNFIRAVRQGKVYVLASDIAAGPRAVVGAAYLTKWFFPESNLKPQDMHSEYFEEFLKQQYSGLYAYPE